MGVLKGRLTKLFQSTLPVRGATASLTGGNQAYMISIHAPREGSDGYRPGYRPAGRNFNPRSP